jgi:hypothetical protein
LSRLSDLISILKGAFISAIVSTITMIHKR